MLSSRSTKRPPTPRRDPYAGEIRKALGEAKARRAKVTHAIVRGIADCAEAGGRA